MEDYYPQSRTDDEALPYEKRRRWLEESPPTDKTQVWPLLEEMTGKRDWYSKVFQDELVAKWRAEVPPEARASFELALSLLRASAQGVNHSDECQWGDGEYPLCDSCLAELRKEYEAERR